MSDKLMPKNTPMPKTQTEAIWETFAPHLDDSLFNIGLSSVSDLTHTIHTIRSNHPDEFDLPDRAIAYEVRHVALRLHVQQQKQVTA